MKNSLNDNIKTLLMYGVEIISIEFYDPSNPCGDPECCGAPYPLMVTELRFPGETATRQYTDDTDFSMAVDDLKEVINNAN